MQSSSSVSRCDEQLLSSLTNEQLVVGGTVPALSYISREFTDAIFTPRFAAAASKVGIPFRQGAEAEARGCARMIVDMSAMPKRLLEEHGATAWVKLLESWCGNNKERDVAVQVMCAWQGCTVLLPHADPGQRRCKTAGERSEILATLPCGGPQLFRLGTSDELPTPESLFGRVGHARKVPVQSLRNQVNIPRPPFGVS